MPRLLVRLVRTSPSHHRLELQPASAPATAVDLETRSFLLHDLVHFALESELGLADAFYGRLARGVSHAALSAPARPGAAGDELLQVESVVGPLQAAWRNGLDPARFVTTLRAHLTAVGAPVPDWLEADRVTRIGERLRALEGRWRATPFGAAMELVFTVPDR